MRLNRSIAKGLAALAVLGATGCDEAAAPAAVNTEEAALTDLEALLADSPDRDKLPDEPKSDQTYPAKFDLVALQSPVRNQQSRGVCSIFSTVALMEHLYIKEGTFKNPDFSEQFLQWSAKVEVKSFLTTDGSNADSNLSAISRFGVVEESAWPYEGRPWTSTNDARCVDKDKPVLCYTNGDPSESTLAARRFKLPPGRWVSSRVNSVKAFMFNNRQAVIAGMTFFYQSWNHRGGSLPVSSEYMSQGYVMYPNDADKEIAEAKPAGHSILIVGWDDTLEVPTLDKDGQVVVDKDGKPVVEKGFFLIKNSWGTGSYGTKNPFGPGYGWLSMRYVEEYASLMGANVPSVNLGPETCGDGVDNNRDGLIDCEELASCGREAACNTATRVFESRPGAAIPDNSEAGFKDVIRVDATGFATAAYVDVRVTHTFVRDLKLVLTAPSGRATVLYDRTLPSGRDIIRRFNLPSLIGESVSGAWTLTVSDLSKGDTGRLAEWKLGLGLAAGSVAEVCDDGQDNDANNLSDCDDPACSDTEACDLPSNPGTLSGISEDSASVPDNDTAGVKSVIELTGAGLVDDVELDVQVTHPYSGDLVVKLVHPDGTVATLSDRQGGSAANIDRSFTTSAFDGKKAAGRWTLWVVDTSAGDAGTLEAWLLDVTTR
jgi:subtilisin-like proprotein convertase family protein